MFQDISSWILSNSAALHYGIAAGMVGSSNQLSFVVCGFGTPNRRLEWTGSALRDTATRRLADLDGHAIGVAAADFNGDGVEEIYILNTDTYAGPKSQSDRLFVRTPEGQWRDLFPEPDLLPLRNMSAGRSVAAIDRRGVGRYGFFVANYGRPMRLYEMSRDGHIHDVAPSLQLDAVTGGRSLWIGPLISESASDLFCGNEHGPNFLYVNDGEGQFAEVAAPCRLGDAEEHARGVVALDANDDGQLDLCYGNWEGPHRLMIRQVDNTFKDQASPAMAMPSPVRTVIAADFDNDGYQELFFNNLGEANRLFRYEAGTWRLCDAGPAALPDGLGTGAAVADIDSDGVLELLIAHGEMQPQPLALFKWPNPNFYLHVMPLTRFGAAARGAKVQLMSAGRQQIRVIDGGSGYLCQMEPVAHFGLGQVPLVNWVRITWPDGATLCLDQPMCNQLHIVEYPLGR